MSILLEYIRPYWLKGINEINGHVKQGLSVWIREREFQIYDPIQSDSATINVNFDRPLISAFASDCNRMASSSFESVNGICKEIYLPKSTAWLAIRLYYSAFFSAHAILRIFGSSCSQVDQPQANAINLIADLYGSKNGINLTKGFYLFKYDALTKVLICSKIDSADGSHGAMWKSFYDLISVINTDISNKNNTIQSRKVVSKLSELCASLNNGSTTGKGAWLSQIRNRTNYRHDFGVWFPYLHREDYCDDLFRKSLLWKEDPMNIPLWLKGRELQRFCETCCIIISICRILCLDISARCPKGHSFQEYGPISLLRNIDCL
jgi:hypothetical protein